MGLAAPRRPSVAVAGAATRPPWSSAEGGFTGGVYEIGALRALDLLAVNSTVNNFDVYVGTSAGSFIAALCANGVTPEEMMQVVTRQGKLPFKDISLGDLLRPNFMDYLRKGVTMPIRAIEIARSMLSQPGGVSLMDVVMGLADGLPSGIYNGVRDRELPPQRPHRARPLRRASPSSTASST